jgi:alpha-amylase
MRRRCPALVLLAQASTFAPWAAATPPVDLSPVPFQPVATPLPPHWQHGVFMEIFVRAWKDSDGDGIGDLRGLTQTLPHLQALGVRGLWLMPIQTNADGDHGYATTDYRAVAPEYGSLADLDELLQQARQRGIGIVIDYVVNHSAAQHPLFVEALKGPDNPYRAWYVWSEEAPQGWDIWGKNPWYHAETEPWLFTGDVKDLPPPAPGAKHHYFGTFGPHMPDFNFLHPPVLAYHLDSLRYWMNRGLAGFRLDAVPHLVEGDAQHWNDPPESRALALRLQNEIKRYPGAYVVCEATSRPVDYAAPEVCGAAFAFGYTQHFVKAALGDEASVRELARYWLTAPPTMATFVSSHDRFAGDRLWDQLAALGAEREAAYRAVAATYLLQPGTPFIYFGEHIGQAQLAGVSGDAALRAPMSWTADPATAGFSIGQPFRPVSPNAATHNVAAQQADLGSLFHFYQAMLALRNTHPSIARGSYLHGQADGLVLSWQRRLDDEHTVVVINHGSNWAGQVVEGLPAGALLAQLYPDADTRVLADAAGRARVALPGRGVRVFRVQR